MEVKVLIIITVLVLVGVLHQAAADFYFNHVEPKAEDLEKNNLKCVPGRTVIKVLNFPETNDDDEEDEDNDDEDTRRSHMNHQPDSGETCQICICSVEGKDEYCSTRPAKNVNECLRLSMITDDYKNNIPYDHERVLAYRIRRDYLWHKDEIPYNPKARCQRGHSYYSNSVSANDTDLEVPSDIDSLLDYSNKDVCFYCVCSVHGDSVGCLSRSSWFCDYYRKIREPSNSRDMYRELFEQDRPAYFRFLSHRLRRTMDNGIYELINSGGDTLCCDHPNGHRRGLQKLVKHKMMQMKKRSKNLKENLMSGHPGGDYIDFVVNND